MLTTRKSMTESLKAP